MDEHDVRIEPYSATLTGAHGFSDSSTTASRLSSRLSERHRERVRVDG
jgi:hypothetical protein